MKLKALVLFAAIFTAVLAAAALPVKAESTKTAAELINQAHKHDNMYTLGSEADQQKALSLYSLALTAKPDDKQRLHILYRMGQLYGSAYQLEKGEKPNFRKAIELYQEIIDSYPPEEPLVYKAASSICDHYTTLREFETAVKWAKKTLEYDTGKLAEQLKTIEQEMHALEHDPSEHGANPITTRERLEARKQVKQGRSLKKALAKIRRYQEIAVDQVAYSAALIDPLRAHGELRAITEKYAGSFIADRAHERLVENMDRMPELWAPQQEDLPAPSNPTLQADFGAPAALSQNQKGIKIQTDIVPEATAEGCSLEPNTTEIPQKDKHVAREARAPPLSYLSKCIIIAAGLIILVLAVVTIRKKTSF